MTQSIPSANLHKPQPRSHDLEEDLSESKDVLATNAGTATKLTALMESYIRRGRSAPGTAQHNDFVLSLTGGEVQGKRHNKRNSK